MAENVNLVKKVYGVNTYNKIIDTNFTELVTPSPIVVNNTVTVQQFFDYYNTLFYDIPISGDTNSHLELVTRSQQYIGGSVIDAEKQALINEINSLRQQIIDLSQTYLSISNITK
jgi:hypothetical protein